MDSPPISDAAPLLSFVAMDGQPLSAPREWQFAFVVVDADPSAWEQMRLRRHDLALPISLRRVGGQAQVVAEWPRSGVGHYGLHLEVNGVAEDRTVTITSEKISPQAVHQLLLDLETDLPASIALSLQRLGALAGLHLQAASETTLAQELVRLRRAVGGTKDRPGLAALLPRLQADPHRQLHTSEVWTPWERARRPHPSRLAHAVAAGPQFARDRPPERVLDTRVEHTVDVYENRLVKVFHAQVDRRLRRLSRAFGADATGRAQTDALLSALAAARRQASFLAEVSQPAHLPTHLSPVLQKRPDYRAALEGFLELHRSPVLRLDEPRLDAPLNNLPALYQTWGTLRIIAALLQAAAEQGLVVQTQRLAGRDADGVFVRLLPDGQPVLTFRHPATRTIVRLTPERAYTRAGHPLRSLSFEQRPDVVVEIFAPGAPPRILLFDPKYKLDGDGTPLKSDMDKMHAYRDAIRDSAGRPVVSAAWILYPGQTVFYGTEIGALGANPEQAAELHDHLSTIFTQALSAFPL